MAATISAPRLRVCTPAQDARHGRTSTPQRGLALPRHRSWSPSWVSIFLQLRSAPLALPGSRSSAMVHPGPTDSVSCWETPNRRTNIERRTSERRTSNTNGRTSSGEHRAENIERHVRTLERENYRKSLAPEAREREGSYAKRWLRIFVSKVVGTGVDVRRSRVRCSMDAPRCLKPVGRKPVHPTSLGRPRRLTPPPALTGVKMKSLRNFSHYVEPAGDRPRG